MAKPSNRPRCAGTARATGAPCGLSAVPGMTVCRHHGGANPRVLPGVKATEALRTFEGLRDAAAPVTDPVGDLLLVAGRAKVLMEFLAFKASELETLRFATNTGEHVRAELSAYERSLDRCARILSDIVKLDLWDRMVRANEAQAQAIIEALAAGMTAAGIAEGTPEWTRARVAAGKALRTVAGSVEPS